MKTIVLDCSVVMAWIFHDEQDQYALEVLNQLEHCDALVPAVWPLEVANALRSAKRRLRLNPDGIEEALTLIESLDVAIDSANHGAADWYALAMDYDVTSYDAAYIDLARRTGAALATLDVPLRRAAQKAGVRVV